MNRREFTRALLLAAASLQGPALFGAPAFRPWSLVPLLAGFALYHWSVPTGPSAWVDGVRGVAFRCGVAGDAGQDAVAEDGGAGACVVVGDGEARVGVPEFRHYNPIGSVHGGFAATLLDSALGCSTMSWKSGHSGMRPPHGPRAFQSGRKRKRPSAWPKPSRASRPRIHSSGSPPVP